jgi:site-specific DNA-cytosine methylase
MAADTDVHASRVVGRAWPHLVPAGDLRKVTRQHAVAWRLRAAHVTHVVLSAGFPCQDLSGLNASAVGLGGPRSGLAHKVLRVFKLVEEVFSDTRIVRFIENVASMGMHGVAGRIALAALLGSEPVVVCASAVSAVRRPCYYRCSPPLQ